MRAMPLKGIGMVFQEQSLLPNLSVAKTCYLGQEASSSGSAWSTGKGDACCSRRQLAKIGVDIDVDALTSELTFGPARWSNSPRR
jgi:ribose transport system ATP-binding protein